MFKKIAMMALPMVMAASIANAGWFDPNSDDAMRKQQEQLMLQAWNAVGMPGITDFAERRQLKQIYELRDKSVATYTYLVGLDGKIGDKICNSVGFGIPYATQYTNPQSTTTIGGQGITTIPQADPNGLFSPASADGTWVLCVDPETKKAVPLYIEPKIIVSPFELQKKQ
jgi:hypothetical protein